MRIADETWKRGELSPRFWLYSQARTRRRIITRVFDVR